MKFGLSAGIAAIFDAARLDLAGRTLIKQEKFRGDYSSCHVSNADDCFTAIFMDFATRMRDLVAGGAVRFEIFTVHNSRRPAEYL